MYTFGYGGEAAVTLVGRALRCIGLPLLILGLMAVTAIDADGDLATSNLPSVVLPGARDLQAVGDSQADTSDLGIPPSALESAGLVRRFRRLLESLGITGQLHLAVRSIRGP